MRLLDWFFLIALFGVMFRQIRQSLPRASAVVDFLTTVIVVVLVGALAWVAWKVAA